MKRHLWLTFLFYFSAFQVFAQKKSPTTAQEPDANWQKYLNDGRVGPRRFGLTTNLIEPLFGMASLGLQAKVNHRFALEGAIGVGVTKPIIDFNGPGNYFPETGTPNEPDWSEYDPMPIIKFKPKFMYYGMIHYMLASAGVNKFFSVGIHYRKRIVGAEFAPNTGYDSYLSGTQIGGFMASQTPIGGRFVMGWLFGMGTEKFKIHNYVYKARYDPIYTAIDTEAKLFGIMGQLKLGYML